MNANNVKRPPRRFDVSYLGTLNIQSYGRDNLYPQRMYDLIQNSPTGGTCCDRYQTFIEGNGLNDLEFSEYVCNRAGETVDDIYRLIAQDMALYHGFALHINYNMACKIVELQHIPFQDCRLEEETEDGQVIHIKVHPDWSGCKTRKGKKITVDKLNVKEFFVFNPIPEVVLSQIDAAGGIESYTGQVLWYSFDGKYKYPKPIYDKVVTNLSTDEGLDNVKYRNTRNNFLMAGMLVHKKGQNISIDEDGQTISGNDSADEDFAKSLDVFQGDMNSCAIMDVTVNQGEDEPKFVSVEGTNFDSKFTCTEKSTTERIYSAFGQEPWYCIRIGSLGFSGTVLSEAYEYYNSYVSKERRAISRALKKIFAVWHEEANRTGDFEVQPMVYVNNKDNGITNNT